MKRKLIGLIALMLMLQGTIICIPDLNWATIVGIIADNADANSEADKQAAIQAYRNISKPGFAATGAAASIKKKFQIEPKDLPKRYSEMNEGEVKAETRNIVNENKPKGFKEFLSAQGVDCKLK